MVDDLPNDFDLVVIGTGFTESCVAAAASRIGKSVLHIDINEHYGGAWASFSLDTFNSLIAHRKKDIELKNASYKWHVEESTPSEPDEEVNTTEPLWTPLKVLEKSRRFNLDLCPKILYSSGELVKLLVSSNICRYAEFRAVDHVCTFWGNDVINVPCSRSDVFNTKDLNIIEKRLLMKFLSTCMAFDENKPAAEIDFRNKTFYEYLKAQRITDKLITCVMQAIAMCNRETSFDVGMKCTKKFLNSLGCYGNTPFLFPMYGCGEIPQCFCRLCAVFGGIYCLKRRIDGITIDAVTKKAQILTEGKTINAHHVVMSHTNVPSNVDANVVHGYGAERPNLSRGIFIASSPLGSDSLNDGGGGVNLLRLTTAQREAIVLQLSHYSGTCPEHTFVFHITTPAVSSDPECDLMPFFEQIFEQHSNSPNLLYSSYFTLMGRTISDSSPTSPLFCTAPPYYELDYDLSIKNARDIFSTIYPSTEFLPRAPDPEEIVVDGEDPLALSEHNLPDDLRAQLHELEDAAQQLEIKDGNMDLQ